MAYRGEDLDLRTPQGRMPRDGYGADNGLNGARSRPMQANGRTETHMVDETVLACCNHAYDVAHAHGAAEVRLEHLVHALTRVEAAAEILEQRGIREAHLRRESASVIASEIPVGLGHSHSAPRASVEFEDVLRRASDQGRTSGGAATVHDLLWVLLNYNREMPAIALLLRHARDWQNWDWPHREYRETRREPTYAERRVYTDPAPPPQIVERIVEVPRPEPVREKIVERVVEVPRHEPQVQAMGYGQSYSLDPVYSRLDNMEQSLRKLQSDIANERRAMAETVRDMMRDGMRDMMREFQREMASMPRGGGAALPTGFVDRIDDFGRTASNMTDRLQALERSVSNGMQDGARNWAALSDKLKLIDKMAAMNPNADIGEMFTSQLLGVTTQVEAATDKLQALERTFETKLRSLDEGVNASRRDGNGVTQMLNERFQAMRQQIEQQNLATASLVAQLTEPVTERLRQIETTVSRPGGDAGLADRLNRIEQSINAVSQVAGQSYQLTSQVGERVRAIEGAAASQPQALVTKLAHLEQLVSSHGDRSVQYTQQVAQQAADAHTRELADLQEAIVKLGTNQQSLSETLDQWRTENEGGISILSNRLEVMETASAQPMQMLKQMQTDLQGLQRLTVADYDQNRKGVRNWLFGTDEIFAGSWRDETRQIRERLAQVREERAEARKG